MSELRETTERPDRPPSGVLVPEHELRELLSRVLNQLTGWLRADDGAIFLLDQAGRPLRGITLEQAQAGGAIEDRDSGLQARWFGRLGTCISLVIPLVAADRCLGLFYANFRDRNAWPARPAIEYAESMAAQAALALDRCLGERNPSSSRWRLPSAVDGVIVADQTGRVLWLNPLGERLTGWSVPAALGRPLEEVFELAEPDTLVRRVLRDGIVIGAPTPTILRAKHGTECSIAYSIAPIDDDRGIPRGAVVLFRVLGERAQPGEAGSMASRMR